MSLEKSDSILIPTFRSITLIYPNEIIYVQAMQNYSKLVMQDGSQVLASISFGKSLELLGQFNVHQCHRSYAIQAGRFVRYLKNGNAELEGDVFIPVARRRRVKFLKLMSGEMNYQKSKI